VLSAANDALARAGVLVLGENALERLANVDTVLFDKTGTLTGGNPHIESTQIFRGLTLPRAREVAAALERESNHPLARAFANFPTDAVVQALRIEPGRGIEGKIDGMTYRLGRADFAFGLVDDGAIWLGAAGTPLARFVIGHGIRADAATAINQLHELGLDVQLASGDADPAVSNVAAALGIEQFHARQSPEHKLARMRGLQLQGRRVLMIGDGINDAPVLAGADVSIAMGSGSALAQRAADVLLLGEQLRRIPAAILLARKTRRVLRQNLAWALIYNAVAIAIAAMGWIHPGIAALGMAGSSLVVTLNALRLARTSVSS
jgi:Cu2+-exporting ATPase